MLTPLEAGELITLLRQMTGQGTIIILISHKLNGVMTEYVHVHLQDACRHGIGKSNKGII
ncbi:hypothetical protein [Desulfitobacterium sp.]|uniref:hypothetical protein n=1 Tax=Desulfitobacterium sp. TaxID=49981 RepID=UPI002C26C6D5|nr:hypothetical protein [Desulfitobacterium sp.]HVJ49717.1 hypothetical protein [Desulfitobacterium sp.]